MTWYYVNCSFILIFTWISYTNSIPGYSIEAPKSVTVQRGLCVHIPCHFTVEKSVTLSERNTEGLWFNGTDKNPPPVAATKGDISEATKGRFFLTGEVWKGDCSLSINDAVPSDSSFYLFRLIYSNKYSFSNIKPEVTVIDPPIITINTTVKGNTTTENTTITVLEGDSLGIICIVDSNPQANISWYDKDKLLNVSVHGKPLSYELRNISSNNTGRYQCKAQNYHWINNRTVEIIVQCKYLLRQNKSLCSDPQAPNKAETFSKGIPS
ncbi:sialic acid-binding Ig-like lectin 8 [Pyxicephalus adspersus]|uniref:sialic acid-binding Ig-like lectin 8 n=1 Tax=Pyxicephalus adspersus TaxID=30357 RepID=UPI003B59975A